MRTSNPVCSSISHVDEISEMIIGDRSENSLQFVALALRLKLCCVIGCFGTPAGIKLSVRKMLMICMYDDDITQ